MWGGRRGEHDKDTLYKIVKDIIIIYYYYYCKNIHDELGR